LALLDYVAIVALVLVVLDLE